MFDIINKLVAKANHYLDTKLSIVKLELIERTTGLMSFFMFLLVSMFVTLIVLIFSGMSMGAYFSQLTGSSSLGFLITALIFLLLLIIMMVFRRPIIKKFSDMYISLLTEKDKENKDE